MCITLFCVDQFWFKYYVDYNGDIEQVQELDCYDHQKDFYQIYW